jgi:hypothetical protein
MKKISRESISNNSELGSNAKVVSDLVSAVVRNGNPLNPLVEAGSGYLQQKEHTKQAKINSKTQLEMADKELKGRMFVESIRAGTELVSKAIDYSKEKETTRRVEVDANARIVESHNEVVQAQLAHQKEMAEINLQRDDSISQHEGEMKKITLEINKLESIDKKFNELVSLHSSGKISSDQFTQLVETIHK